ncbi:toxin ChpB (plasmid) [Candidatus Williamhamiltonella defendens]|uniref:Toxin ChpB n=1 Tax=Candidatus Williamhamiltonella defendens TaxID=138072 RepID=A0A2D3TAJ7_9ENTR|nr:type II toxin-antitoxin system ChpB family toxin [Candidatus Hamiltonella defensa]ATW30797.1 toxin ChpB [Candidatus Hamiltonella defensa]ATW32832.1 toxin ChpB [Candidatus Hamiltonella defensa]
MAVFERCDIVLCCLNPTSGKELQGDFRPCLVLSPINFNKLGLTLIAPITQGGDFARFRGFSVPLMGTGTETQGVILTNGIRMVDLIARKAKKIEKVPEYIVNEVLAILGAILD